MSRNESGKMRSTVQNQKVPAKHKSPRKPDARVQRTRDQLGTALIQLIVEKPINDVTVQDVLDRAGVGRSTFYLHFRDKDDLLVSQLEMFLEFMSTTLSVRNDKSNRVAPVAEMFEHIGNQNKLYRVLSDSRPSQGVLRSRRRLLRPRHRAAPQGIRPFGKNAASRTGRARLRTFRQPAVSAALVARSRRERIAKRDGRNVPPHGLEWVEAGRVKRGLGFRSSNRVT